MKNFIVIFACLFCLISSSNLYGYWINNNNSDTQYQLSSQINVGEFSYFPCACVYATLIIDDVFYEKYMTLLPNGEYDWKRDVNGNVLNMVEIASLTPLGTIIKADICYEVIGGFNLITYGIPNKDNPISWAISPTTINYVPNWSYRVNRVVKGADNQFYISRYYVDWGPCEDRNGWDKIEPPTLFDFNFYNGTNAPCFLSPKLENIHLSYIWDSQTNYPVNSIVFYDGFLYKAIITNNGYVPMENSWAWIKV